MGEIIAVIDTETNYSNNLITVGMVAADSATFDIIDEYYGLFDPAYKSFAMFSHVIKYSGVNIDNTASPKAIFTDMKEFLVKNGVSRIFAYNAKFDYSHLTEFHNYEWYDIMRLAAYRQFNDKIIDDFECCRTGRLKCHYGVESIYRLLSGNYGYREIHNALVDARDELKIMKMLGKCIEEYEIARI